MQFQFEGETYQIEFAHPVPTYLAYHVGHETALLRETNPKNLHPCGPTRLYCDTCEAKFGRPVEICLRKKEAPRRIECSISIEQPLEDTKPQWLIVYSGRSKLNRRAKDQYTREGGRKAALNDALSLGVNPEFQAAALAAYQNRFHKGLTSQAGTPLW
jgi:hypothetical protein